MIVVSKSEFAFDATSLVNPIITPPDVPASKNFAFPCEPISLRLCTCPLTNSPAALAFLNPVENASVYAVFIVLSLLLGTPSFICGDYSIFV
jgi:hypothetical protein